MVEIVNVSATLAAWASDAARAPAVVPRSIAAREARKIQLLQERDDVGEHEVIGADPVLQAAMAGLDLMNDNPNHPQSTLTEVLRSYADND